MEPFSEKKKSQVDLLRYRAPENFKNCIFRYQNFLTMSFLASKPPKIINIDIYSDDTMVRFARGGPLTDFFGKMGPFLVRFCLKSPLFLEQMCKCDISLEL